MENLLMSKNDPFGSFLPLNERICTENLKIIDWNASKITLFSFLK